VLSWWRRLHALVMTACKTPTASARKTTPDCEFLVSLDQAVLFDGRLSVGVSWRANLSPPYRGSQWTNAPVTRTETRVVALTLFRDVRPMADGRT
jgi:hypothetical protein